MNHPKEFKNSHDLLKHFDKIGGAGTPGDILYFEITPNQPGNTIQFTADYMLDIDYDG